jgi:surface glycoprotein (TIGR04207 family)
MSNNTADKLRSLFLASLMVFSVFAGSIAFAGTAAAANDPTGLDFSATSAGNVPVPQNEQVTTDIDFTVDNLNDQDSGQTVNFTVSAEDGVEFSSLNSVAGSTSSSAQVNGDGDIVFAIQPSSSGTSRTITLDGAVIQAPQSTGDYDLTVNVTDDGGANAETTFSNVIQVTNSSNLADTGYLSGRISDQNNNDVPNATVTATRQSDGLTRDTQTNSNGEYTLEVPDGTYNITVERPGFNTTKAFNNKVNPGSTTTANLVITRVINADDISVIESDSVAVADGTDQVSYTVEVTTNDTENDLTPISGVTVDASGPADVNFTSTQETTDNNGTATFTATSGVVGEYDISFTDEQGNSVNATATFRPEQGNSNIAGEVRSNETEPIADATVWAAYQGENQTLAYAEANQPYLVSQTTADGSYTIEGLVSANGPVNLYVEAGGYNRINATDSVGAYVAANESQNLVAGDTENHDFVLFPGGPAQEYQLDVTVEDQKRIEAPTDTQVTATVTVEQRQKGSSYQWAPAENTEIQIDTTDNLPLDPDAVTETTDANGEVTLTYSAENTGDTNITAEVTNDEGDVFNTTGSEQANVSVYGTGEITGDVVNEDDEELAAGQATVQLFVLANDGEYEPVTDIDGENVTSEIGSSGSYVFTDVRSGETYRVVATTETGLTGQATTAGDIPAGTTTNDIVVVGADPSPASFEVSDLSPQDVSVSQGDNITVSANITNTGIAEGTQSVEFRVGGDVIASQEVSLNGSETKTVTFEDISTANLDAGDYEHGVYTDDDQQTAQLTVTDGNNDGSGDVTQGQVIDAIVQYNSGGDISQQQVIDLIVQYNS